jgi:phosphoribosyl-ATP pyrophosphohydrolase/phosphoribosyl-AMP cyclohydrolase
VTDIVFDENAIDWSKTDGLVPAVVQDTRSMRVLMLGYVNREALQKTIATGLVTFYSRSKQRLWQKGETSGHVLWLRSIRVDCDGDTLLIQAEPEGPTCHLGTQSCFGDDEAPNLAALADLAKTIHARRSAPEPGSYTAKLFEAGIQRIAQKVGEEGVEVALAATMKSSTLAGEAADLLYHLLVLLEASEIDLIDVMRILRERASGKKPGKA